MTYFKELNGGGTERKVYNPVKAGIEREDLEKNSLKAVSEFQFDMVLSSQPLMSIYFLSRSETYIRKNSVASRIGGSSVEYKNTTLRVRSGSPA